MEGCATGLNFSLLLYSFTGLVEGVFCSTKFGIWEWFLCGYFAWECETSAPSGTEVRLWIVGSIWKENDRGGLMVILTGLGLY